VILDPPPDLRRIVLFKDPATVSPIQAGEIAVLLATRGSPPMAFFMPEDESRRGSDETDDVIEMLRLK
jgi:hypothetical protein